MTRVIHGQGQLDTKQEGSKYINPVWWRPINAIQRFHEADGDDSGVSASEMQHPIGRTLRSGGGPS